MAICWEVGQSSSVHNHREQNCWMAVPIGRLRVENFRTIAQDLDRGTCKLETADTVEMNPRQPCAVDPLEPVHRVYNPREFNQRAVSLHVYSRPFDTCVVYSQEQGTCGVIKLHYQTEYGKPVKATENRELKSVNWWSSLDVRRAAGRNRRQVIRWPYGQQLPISCPAKLSCCLPEENSRLPPESLPRRSPRLLRPG